MAQPVTRAGQIAAGALFGALARTFGTRPLHPEGWAFEASSSIGMPFWKYATAPAR